MRMDDNQSKSNLIVNYLPQMLTDLEFKNVFQSVGPVKSAKIIRHKTTGYSYGFGFVEYARESDAEKAVETLNGHQLQNKRIKVAFSRPGGDNIKNANLYVKGIPKMMTEEELQKVFEKFGEIIQCRILQDSAGLKNKGIAFILFDQHRQAEDAVKKLNGTILDGGTEPLVIKYAKDNKQNRPSFNPGLAAAYDPFAASFGSGRFGAGGPIRQSLQGRLRFNPMANNIGGLGAFAYNQHSGLAMGGGDGHILFVYNIGTETLEKQIWQLFARYGTVKKVNIIREGATGAGKGYGFVTMPNYDEAVLAIESLNGLNFFGKPLQVSFKTPK